MATQNRIYVVHHDGKPAALVRARSQSEAIRHHIANQYEAIVADQDHLVRLIGDGFKIEDAAAAPEPAAG